VNYLTYDSLEEAKQNKLISLIGSKFTVTDENYFVKEIIVGNDENESTIEVNSATQKPRAYVLSMESKELVLRLIDTPGIADTRG
jgi:hypothetical protein